MGFTLLKITDVFLLHSQSYLVQSEQVEKQEDFLFDFFVQGQHFL